MLSWFTTLIGSTAEATVLESEGSKEHSTSYWWPLMEDCVSYPERVAMGEFLIENSRLTYGEQISRFEAAWNAWNGSQNSLYVSSGTGANYLIIAACKCLYGWSTDSEILVPAVTWGTTISSLINLGVKPVPVDIDLRTLSMDLADAARRVTKNTKAIFITHLLGIPNDLDAVRAFAKEHDLILLEDCCESHGALWEKTKVGNFGLASSFSFYWGHHLTTVEGGMVCTPNDEFADTIRSLRNHGLTRDMKNGSQIESRYPEIDKRFLFHLAGFNARGTETYAYLGQMQLKRLDQFIEQRNENYRQFILMTAKYRHLFDTFYPPIGGEVSCFALAFLFHNAVMRTKVSQAMEKEGIETRPLVTGNLVRQPFMAQFHNQKTALPLPGADRIHNCGMYIGNNQFIHREHIERLDGIFAKI